MRTDVSPERALAMGDRVLRRATAGFLSARGDEARRIAAETLAAATTTYLTACDWPEEELG